uniref:Mitochondrial import inner membrane translocase subunit TIM50 n=1 Tax=Trypanosoma congolense (strain IL3000) TaxID=1068625 RepID=G0UK37_TRYCI|nr:conserved hypothetical protein [Trypanosoma congolense IL3000]
MVKARLLLNLVVPFVTTLVQIVVDGVDAWRNIGESLYVIFCFFTRRSHLDYPPQLNALRRRKAEMARKRRLASTPSTRASSGRMSATESHERSLLASSSTGDDAYCGEEGWQSDSTGGGISSENDTGSDCWVERRVLGDSKSGLGQGVKKSLAKRLVSQNYHLCYSESLYRLVCNVVGPIQPPSVSALPRRHTAPQWPPHSTGRSAFRRGLRDDDVTFTTDDYSSTASAQSGAKAGRILKLHGLPGNAAVSDPGGSGRIIPGLTSVVYRRESSKRVEFDRKGESRMPVHSIASITAHHVLSYQATRQKVLILDLDETLCFVSTNLSASSQPPSFSEVIPTASGAELFHVWERPYVKLFLRTMSKLFNLVLFTSSTKPYADSILRRIDPDHYIERRYYRQHCRQVKRVSVNHMHAQGDTGGTSSPATSSFGHNSDTQNTAPPGVCTINSVLPTASKYPSQSPSPEKGGGLSPSLPVRQFHHPGEMLLVKDIRIMKVPPELMIMIDNAEECVAANRDNALLIPAFAPPSHPSDSLGDDASDDVLLAVMPLLEALLVVPDVRSVLRHGRPAV